MSRYELIEDLLAAYEDGSRPVLEFTNHALHRGVEMAEQVDLAPDEIQLAMREPERFYLSEKYEGTLNLIRERVCLAVRLNAFGNPVVVTVLWAKIRDWKRSYGTAAPEGRERRFGVEPTMTGARRGHWY